MDVLHEYLDRNQIDLLMGEAKFLDPHRVEISRPGFTQQVTAAKILVGCGTRPARPPHIPFDGETIFDSDELLQLKKIPRSMIVVGAGVIGIEYAIMFATLGVEVTVVDGRERLLDFCDREIVEMLMWHARSLGMVFRLGEDMVRMTRTGERSVIVELESGKRLLAESALFSAGRTGTWVPQRRHPPAWRAGWRCSLASNPVSA